MRNLCVTDSALTLGGLLQQRLWSDFPGWLLQVVGKGLMVEGRGSPTPRWI